MQLIYFASIREKIGTGEEAYTPPADVTTVETLLNALRARSPHYAAALSAGTKVRVAVNQQHAQLSSPVSDKDEVAIFPPVTGG